MVSLTIKVSLDLQISHTEPEDGEFVQTTFDLLGEGQEASQALQLPVETVAVTLGRVCLRGTLHDRRLHPGAQGQRE